MKSATTWTLVADGAKARIYESHGSAQDLRELEHLALTGSRKLAKEIMSDKPGRVYDSAGHGRHAMAYTKDPKQLQERRFIEAVAQLLARHSNDYERLRLVVAPAALGDIRQCLPEQVAKKVDGEIDQDLTNLSNQDVVSHLAKVWGPKA